MFVARSSGQRLPGQEITGGAPTDDAAFLLAQARQLLGTDPVTALELYDQVLDLRPDDPEALTYSGWLLVITSRGASDEVGALALETGKQSLLRAAEVDPTYAAAYNNLAIAYEHNGQFDNARTAYEKALELEPNNVLIKQNYDLFREINDRANRNSDR